MTSQIGAPGRGVSRRQFLAVTGGSGAASLAGCTAPTKTERLDTSFAQTNGNRLPLTGKPEVVNVDDLGGGVTLKIQHGERQKSSRPAREVGGHDRRGRGGQRRVIRVRPRRRPG